MNTASWNVRRIACVALMAYCFAARIASANEAVFRNALASAVFVVSPTGRGAEVSFGTGVVIDCNQRTVVTAWHVVENRHSAMTFFAVRDEAGSVITDPKYYVRHKDQLAINANVVAGDATKDVAVLQLDTMPANAAAVPLAARSPSTAENVHAIGNSGVDDGVLWRYSSGTVRSVYEKIIHYKSENGETQTVSAKIVETQCPTNPGDSGGPIINDAGQLVAITTGSDPSETNVEFGIDVSEIRSVMAIAGLACGTPTQLVPPEAFVNRRPFAPIGSAQPVAPVATAEPAAPVAPRQAAQATNQASATIDDIRNVPDITRQGQRGLEIHVNLKTNNVEGVPCTVAALVADENGRTLQATSDAYTAPGTNAKAVTARIVSKYDRTTFTDIVLFIPYDQMTSGLPESDLYNFTILVDVCTDADHRWITPGAGRAKFQLQVKQQ